jgi:hypothetical protein
VSTILAFGLAAAVYPQLLAVVIVILTRPEPRRLLWACYLGALSMSLACGAAVLFVFRDRGTIAGSSSHRLGGSAYLVVGVIAVLIAAIVATERGGAMVTTGLARVPSPGGKGSTEPGRVARLKTRATESLAHGSVLVAAAVGAALGIPGPFDVLALGRTARAGYSVLGALLVLVAFNLLKFLLIEIPILSYTLEPARTANRIHRFSGWMRDNKLKVVAAVVAVVGLLLIARGISRLG